MNKSIDHVGISPKGETQNIPTPELSGTKTMEKNREEFEQKFGNFSNALTSSLGLENGMMRSLIAHESRFEVNAHNEHGSKWLMQLTSSPINDLIARPQIYAPLFQKIQLDTLPPNSPIELRDLVIAFQAQPIDKKGLQLLIPALQKLKANPAVNLLIGHIFLASLEARSSPRIENRKQGVEKTLQTLLNSQSLTQQVFKRVLHILPGVSPEELIKSMTTLQSDKTKQSEFLAIRDYNGNNQSYGSGIRHCDIYASVVMMIQSLSQENPRYGARISGATTTTVTKNTPPIQPKIPKELASKKSDAASVAQLLKDYWDF